MRENKRVRILPITLMFILMVMLCISGTAEASSSKVVKSVTLKIGKKKVTNQTCYLVEGKTATLKVSVNPSKAKKSVSYKSSNKKIATVSKKYVVDERAWNEDVYEEKWVCYGSNSLNEKCGFYADTYEEISKHNSQTRHAYGWDDVKVGTIHHKEVGHYETVVTDRKCTVCGVLDSQL